MSLFFIQLIVMEEDDLFLHLQQNKNGPGVVGCILRLRTCSCAVAKGKTERKRERPARNEVRERRRTASVGGGQTIAILDEVYINCP